MSTTCLRQGYDIATTWLRHVYDSYDMSTTSTTWLRHLRHGYDIYDTLRHATTCYDMPRHATTALLKRLLTCIQQHLNTIEEIIR
jgi:hypothetical protein